MSEDDTQDQLLDAVRQKVAEKDDQSTPAPPHPKLRSGSAGPEEFGRDRLADQIWAKVAGGRRPRE